MRLRAAPARPGGAAPPPPKRKGALLNVSMNKNLKNEKQKQIYLQAQRILPNLPIPPPLRSIRRIQHRRPRCIPPKAIKIHTPTPTPRHKSIRVMRRIERSRDRIFGVRFTSCYGDGVVRDEERGNVGEGGVVVAEEVDEWEAELRGLWVERLCVGRWVGSRGCTYAEIRDADTAGLDVVVDLGGEDEL